MSPVRRGGAVPSDSAPISVRERVIAALAAATAADVPGVTKVTRGAPLPARWLAGSPVRSIAHDGQLDVRIRFPARRGTPLPDLAKRVRHAVASAVERQMDLRLGEVTAIVDGVRG